MNVVDMKKNTLFRPVVTGTSHRWLESDFDLKFDAKWTNQLGSNVKMNAKEIISVEVNDRQKKMNGMRFATKSEWVSLIAGRTLRISLTTQAEKQCFFRTAYLTQDASNSGFYIASANTQETTFSFNFQVPESTRAKTHFVIFDPQEDNLPINIIDANIIVI